MTTRHLYLTLGELREQLGILLDQKKVSQAASILSVERATEGGPWQTDYRIFPGTIVMGIEWMDDGKLYHGLLKFAPQSPMGTVN